MKRRFRLNLGLFAAAITLLAAPGAVSAAEEAPADEDIEINLEALDTLNPEREEPALPADDEAPPLPGANGNATDGPPAVIPAPETIRGQELPENPAAPRPDLDTAAATSDADAKRLQGRVTTLLFERETENLTLQATEELDQVAHDLEGNAARVELVAFAGSREQSPSETRRLALRRALATRSYLMNKGIAGSRIDLKPKGPVEDDSAPDRVDIRFVVR